MNAVIYARFSSSSQREASIEEQVKVCREYAQKHEHEIVDIYSDNAISGKTDERPSLRKLLADSAKHKFDTVLVYSIDRFGRNLMQTLTNENKLVINGVTLVSATENFTEDPSGRFFRNMMMAQAQFYSEELAEKIKRGMDYNAERYMYNGGGVPLGYRINSEKRYEIDPEMAPFVQTIFQMYADGSKVSEITEFLNSQGVKTSTGVAFNKNSLHTILNNRRYLGYYIHKDVETRGEVPQIVSDELFERVAKKLKVNRKTPARAKAKVEYLLTTKLFCG
ncbi:MAG: recombinase family protein [Oscillospiraceae bacterium]|nr:recombinase family protein [Oscillospiraceae bacterium]